MSLKALSPDAGSLLEFVLIAAEYPFPEVYPPSIGGRLLKNDQVCGMSYQCVGDNDLDLAGLHHAILCPHCVHLGFDGFDATDFVTASLQMLGKH